MAAAKSKKKREAKRSKKSRRKRHIQQELFRRGGRRRGAGRKSTKPRPGRRHGRRPDFSARHPLHVVLRVDPAVRTLRRRAMYKAIRGATLTAAQKQRIRIIHISLQRSHIHMLVEAADRVALSRGMQGFQISAARYINSALGKELVRAPQEDADEADACEAAAATSAIGAARCMGVARTSRRRPMPRRCGRVFVQRYYAEVITTPTQALRALSYLLNNWRKHGEDRSGIAATWLVDPFSTGIVFPDWLELADKHFMWQIRETYDPLFVYRPTTWLLAEGWKRVGTISARTTPSAKR